MEDRAAVLLSAFDAREITMDELAEALHSATPEFAQFIGNLFSTVSLIHFDDQQRRRHARSLCSQFVSTPLLLN